MSKPKNVKKSPLPTAASSAPDVSQLTAKQAQQLMADLQAKLNAATAASATSEDIKEGTAALIASRSKQVAEAKNARDGVSDKVYEVKSLVAATVFVNVTDGRGEKVQRMFENRGAVEFLTEAQIAEIRDATPFFDLGYLSAPEVVESNSNVIEDYDQFVKNVDTDKISDRLSQVDNAEILLGLYHHLENKRFEVKNGEVVKRAIDGKSMIVLNAVMDRVSSLTGINFSSNDSE